MVMDPKKDVHNRQHSLKQLLIMDGGRIFYVGGQSRGLGGKEKSILLNIKRVRKLKYR